MGVVDQGGRFQSERTREEIETLLDQELKGCTPAELEAYFSILKDFERFGHSPAHAYMEKKFYRTPPVDMETFLRDPYFLGQYGESIYKSINEDLTEMFTGKYNEAIYGGAIGVGKSTLGKVALLRMLYEATCLRNVHETYRVAYGDKVAFLAISITKYRAQQVILDDVIRIISSSPYFMGLDPHITREEVKFPSGLWLAPGASTEQMTIGLNCFGCVMDEINFFANPAKTRKTGPAVDDRDRAEAIYTSIRRRMESRFMEAGGRLPGMIVILSSKKALNSFTERRIIAAKDDPNIFVRERALWEVKGSFSGDTFRVAIGTDTKMSRLLSINEPDPEDMRVIRVPIEFGKSFEDDLDGSIRDIAGFATPSITPFIQRRDKIAGAINSRRLHPFEQFVWVQNEKIKPLWDYLCERKNGEWRPRLNPMAPRHIHLDLSRNNDATGISMVHVGGAKAIDRIGDTTEVQPVYVVDFALRIEAATNGEIIQSEIRKFIYALSAHGFFIKKISCDTYQSVGMQQALGERGYNVEEVSMDRTDKPYVVLKQALYEDRMDYYRYEPLLKELRELEKNQESGKVDHPTPGSKDISDALAGAVWTLSQVATVYEEGSMTAAEAIEQEFSEMQEEAWVLDNGTVQVHDAPGTNQPEWREEANRKIQEQNVRDGQERKKYIDWKKEFELPFEMG